MEGAVHTTSHRLTRTQSKTHVAFCLLVRALFQQQGGDVVEAAEGSHDQRGVPVLR